MTQGTRYKQWVPGRAFWLALTAGLGFWLQALHAQTFVRDAEIENFLETLSAPVLRAAGIPPQSLKIRLIFDSKLNAFVAGGGYNVFIHTGLLTKAKRPEEILSVVAHEIGHIAAGHISLASAERERAQSLGLLTLLLGLGTAFATGDNTAIVAGAAAAQDAGLRSYFSYSRAQESTADQAMVRYLGSMSLSPDAAVEVFDIIKRENAIHGTQENVYLRSHPLPNERIDAMRRAVESSPYRGHSLPSWTQTSLDLIQAKIHAHEARSRDQILLRYPSSDLSTPARYARAIATYRFSSLNQALPLIDELISSDPSNPYFHELKGQALLERGYVREASFAYAQALKILPDESLFQAGYALSLIEQKQPGLLVEAERYIREALRSEQDNPGLWRLLANALGKQGKQGESHLAIAESLARMKDWEQAGYATERAIASLAQGSPSWQRAQDLKLQAQREFKKKKKN